MGKVWIIETFFFLTFSFSWAVQLLELYIFTQRKEPEQFIKSWVEFKAFLKYYLKHSTFLSNVLSTFGKKKDFPNLSLVK